MAGQHACDWYCMTEQDKLCVQAFENQQDHHKQQHAKVQLMVAI